MTVRIAAALRRSLFAAVALASLAGAAQAGTTVAPFSNLQPSLVLNEDIDLQGSFPTVSNPNGNETGFIYNFAGTITPQGSALSQGQVLPISSYTPLFSLVGTTYGGNGTTNFALPNLSGRVVVGSGSGAGAPALGQATGSATVTISQPQLPAPYGSGQPFDNVQPSLGIQTLIDANGIFPGANTATFIGEVANFAGTITPQGWLPADGRLLPISANTALFSVVGTTYGGDGKTTFALPNLQGRVVVGADAVHPLGSAFGQDSPVLTLANLKGAPVDNHQASLALTYLIAVQGTFPGGFDPNQPVIGQVVAYAGEGVTPAGYLPADGQLLNISQYTALFSLLGTTYGGDGKTTFALPNLQGRAIMGSGGGYTLGELLGADQTTLSVTTTGVPEPAAWALMLLGLAALGAMLRARRGGLSVAQAVGA